MCCPSCGTWQAQRGTLVSAGAKTLAAGYTDDTILLSDVPDEPLRRIRARPFDDAFGPDDESGFALGMVNLIGGSPGAGKSTLALQLANAFELGDSEEVLYVAGEESARAIKNRARRLAFERFARVRILPLGSTTNLATLLENRRPRVMVVDSLPGLGFEGDEGVEFCERLKSYAVESDAVYIIIDHVNKQGDMAGMLRLQHVVDGTFSLFPEEPEHREYPNLRVLEVQKNRNGPCKEVFLDMTAKGLVPMPDELIFDDEDDDSDD